MIFNDLGIKNEGKPITGRMNDPTAHVNNVGNHRLPQGSGLPGGTMPRMVSMLFGRFETPLRLTAGLDRLRAFVCQARKGQSQGMLLKASRQQGINTAIILGNH